MKAYQLFQYLSPALAADIVKAMQTEQREAYRAALTKLAESKRLRPIFIQRKSREDQARWMSDQLRLKTSDEMAESLLQVWLIKCQKDLIISFLNKAGIEHDGEGSIEDLPKTLNKKKLAGAIEDALGNYPREIVAVYLHVFQMQEGEGWPELAEHLATNPRLRLAQQPAEETPATATTPEPAAAEPAADSTAAAASGPAAKAPAKKTASKKAARKAPAKKNTAKKKSAE